MRLVALRERPSMKDLAKGIYIFRFLCRGKEGGGFEGLLKEGVKSSQREGWKGEQGYRRSHLYEP